MHTLEAPVVAPFVPHMRSARRNVLAEMVRATLSFTNDPARRFRALWYFVAWCCVSVIGIIGAGYAFGGSAANMAAANTSFRLVINIEPGGLRTHGFIMVTEAIFLIYGLNDFRRITRIGLMVMCFYSLATALLVFGSWTLYSVTWGGPWWYLLVATLSGGLCVLAPPLDSAGRRFRGVTEGRGRA